MAFSCCAGSSMKNSDGKKNVTTGSMMEQMKGKLNSFIAAEKAKWAALKNKTKNGVTTIKTEIEEKKEQAKAKILAAIKEEAAKWDRLKQKATEKMAKEVEKWAALGDKLQQHKSAALAKVANKWEELKEKKKATTSKPVNLLRDTKTLTSSEPTVTMATTTETY